MQAHGQVGDVEVSRSTGQTTILARTRAGLAGFVARPAHSALVREASRWTATDAGADGVRGRNSTSKGEIRGVRSLQLLGILEYGAKNINLEIFPPFLAIYLLFISQEGAVAAHNRIWPPSNYDLPLNSVKS